MTKGSETILVVEDERSVSGAHPGHARTAGLQGAGGGDKDQAFRLVAEHGEAIDLLLSDVVMPDMDGKELSERILAFRPGLKRLFMSGYSEDVIARQGILEEGVQFICKPFTLKGLSVKIREALGEPRQFAN